MDPGCAPQGLREGWGGEASYMGQAGLWGHQQRLLADNGIYPQGMEAFHGVAVPYLIYYSLKTGELEMLHLVALS